jgi:hypothetical protein
MPTLQEIAASASRPRRSTLGTVMEGARGGELRAYEPGVMDNVRNFAMNALAPLFGGDVRAANAYYRDKVQPTLEFLPGVGDVMAAGEARDAFGQGDYLGGGLLAAGAMAGLVPGVGDAVQKGASKAAKGIRAYHGSPHDFDKFSLDKIGTGEGAQAYGHGLYFAENEGVAKSYRDALGGRIAPSRRRELQSHHRAAARMMYEDGMSQVEIGDILKKSYPDMTDQDVSDVLQAEFPGKMYEVNINANPEDFLDWDKPLSEQPESIRGALQNFPVTTQIRDGMPLGPNANLRIDVDPDLPEYPRYFMRMDDGTEFRLSEKDLKNFAAQSMDEASGKTALTTIANELGISEREASQKLREAGIPGIKYLDAGSRGAGDGSRNYVVFDDSLIEILRKYGVLPAAIGTGAFMQMMENDPEQAQQLHDYAVSIRDGA